jgi:hypothetical protein
MVNRNATREHVAVMFLFFFFAVHVAVMLYAVCILDQEIGKTFALHHIKTNGFFILSRHLFVMPFFSLSLYF